ncbi:MAG: hypothetical protein GY717_15515 [Rhodobacteraceae bacterium]|nr:hypothetical protein [Paracoccaceae bacterium]
MRNFLTSEIANFYRLINFPDDPDLALSAGRQLAENLLELLVETFGSIDIRSGYRHPDMNEFGSSPLIQPICG